MSEVEFPDALDFLFEPKRYKVAYGGRGAAKSWGFARALLIQGSSRPLRVGCFREIQKSIADSVHKLLSDQIKALGLEDFYEIQQTNIRGKNGTEFAFAGLRHNIGSLKSFEGLDIAWVEEAQTVSKASWEILIPTIRKEGSEIWVSFNPELDTDETYARFVLNPSPNAIVRKVNWSDNPWFPSTLDAERLHLKERDEQAYLTVWEGHCRQVLDGAIYAKEIIQATKENRITRVPYDRSQPVHTFWDLGWSDNTSIWFAQSVGFEYRVIDFIQDRGRTVAHFLKLLQDREYVYGTDYLPHDAANGTLAADGRSIADIMRAAKRDVTVLPKVSITEGINAARIIFPAVWFDADKCADGLQCLRRYRYDVDEVTGQYSKTPLHDENSHAADAFRYLAMSLEPGARAKRKARYETGHKRSRLSHMAA